METLRAIGTVKELPSATRDADGNIHVDGDLVASDLRVAALDDSRVPGGPSLLPLDTGVVTFRVDDGYSDVETAATLAKVYGIPLSLAINPSRQVLVTGGFLTTAQVLALYTLGNEITNHGYTHDAMPTGALDSPAQYAAEVTAAQAWFEAQGINCEAWVTAGRGAVEGPGSIAEWENTYFGQHLRRIYKLCVSLGHSGIRPLPLTSRFALAEVLNIEDSTGGTAGRMQAAQRWLNHVAGEPMSLHLYWHRTNTLTGNYISSANLTALLKHAAMLKEMGKLEIKTFAQLARSVGQGGTGSIIANGSFERISPGGLSGVEDSDTAGIWNRAGQTVWLLHENTDIHGGDLQTLLAATTTLAGNATQNEATLTLTDASGFPDAAGMVEVRRTAAGVAPPYRITYTGRTTGATETLTGCSRHPAFTSADGYTVRLVGQYPTGITSTVLTCTGAFAGLSDKVWVRFLIGPGSGLEPVEATVSNDNELTFTDPLPLDSKGELVHSTATLFELQHPTTLAHSGRNYVWLKGGVAGGTSSSTFKLFGVPVIPGRSYRISWRQYPLTAAKIMHVVIDGRTDYQRTTGTAIYAAGHTDTTKTNNAQEVWEQQHICYTVPASTNYRTLGVQWQISGGGMGPMLLDDVEVVEI